MVHQQQTLRFIFIFFSFVWILFILYAPVRLFIFGCGQNLFTIHTWYARTSNFEYKCRHRCITRSIIFIIRFVRFYEFFIIFINDKQVLLLLIFVKVIFEYVCMLLLYNAFNVHAFQQKMYIIYIFIVNHSSQRKPDTADNNEKRINLSVVRCSEFCLPY